MHKATFLVGTLKLMISPAGPILIKAGETGKTDPALPDMQFVRSRSQVYLPGASLKGVVRAQAERICRSLDKAGRNPDRDDPPLADNPLGNGASYGGLEDMQFNSGRYIEAKREEIAGPQRTATIYRRSSFVSRLFGHTSLAGRVHFADAYPATTPVLEERNGVAIDRIYGSVAGGSLFNYETAVAGDFPTSISFKNVTLAQLALLGLALRDLEEGRIRLGFGKSRGLGQVNVALTSLELFYPTCEPESDTLSPLHGTALPAGHFAGLGALLPEAAAYGLRKDDHAPIPDGLALAGDELFGKRLVAEGHEQVRAIWRACMPAWRREIGL